MKIERTESGELGAAMVEAALIMLTLLILLFAIFEAGRVINMQQTLTNAAREVRGCRFCLCRVERTLLHHRHK